MSSTEANNPAVETKPRQRLLRGDRHRQLIEVAWRVVREEGTEALTLGRLAEQAGVTKPVVYDHFETRSGLLAALFRDYDARQTALMDAALEASQPTLADRAGVIAACYVDCVLAQASEFPGVVAALAGSKEMEKIKRDFEVTFIEKCRVILVPFTSGGVIAPAGLWAMYGAAEALSYAAAIGEITAEQAQGELVETITAMVGRAGRPNLG